MAVAMIDKIVKNGLIYGYFDRVKKNSDPLGE
jgi:hypothetical protein